MILQILSYTYVKLKQLTNYSAYFLRGYQFFIIHHPGFPHLSAKPLVFLEWFLFKSWESGRRSAFIPLFNPFSLSASHVATSFYLGIVRFFGTHLTSGSEPISCLILILWSNEWDFGPCCFYLLIKKRRSAHRERLTTNFGFGLEKVKNFL